MPAQEQNLTKLEQLLSLINEGLTREEFVTAFENVVAIVLKIEKRNSDSVDQLEATYATLLEKIRGDHTASLEEVKTSAKYFLDDANQLLSTAKSKLAAVDQKLAAIDARMASVMDGTPGLPGKDGARGKDGSPDTAEQVRDKLETLEGDDRLDITAIKGLEDYETLKTGSKQVYMAGGSRNAVEFTDLSAQLDGSTKTFTVPRRRFIMLLGTEFPVIYRPEIDYTGSGTYTLSLTSEVSAPQAGQTLILLHSRI